MKRLMYYLHGLMLLASMSFAGRHNQTDTFSQIYSDQDLPFKVSISQAFELPFGIQDFAIGTYAGKWLMICGRTAGLHGFIDGPSNFALRDQNPYAIVVDPKTQQVWTRSLLDTRSGLSANEIEALIVVSPQSIQLDTKLYVCGGYGPGLNSKEFYTRDTLSIIDIPQWMAWVMRTNSGPRSLCGYIKTLNKEFLRVTGGKLLRSHAHAPLLLALGQNFSGIYDVGSNGVYTKQVRPFWLMDSKQQLFSLESHAEAPQESYRRRDLSIVPYMNGQQIHFLALSGVFTLDTGAWTIPIDIAPDGHTCEKAQSCPGVFKQGLNNYECANITLYSARHHTNYILLFGGMSLLVAKEGSFKLDELIPFTNAVSVLAIDRCGDIKQHYLGELFPAIYTADLDPTGPLRFGSSAEFIANPCLQSYGDQIIDLDSLRSDIPLGYIVGGIASSVANDGNTKNTTASKYVFQVKLRKTRL